MWNPIIASDCLRQSVIAGEHPDASARPSATRVHGATPRARQRTDDVSPARVRFWLGEHGENIVTLNAGDMLQVPSRPSERQTDVANPARAEANFQGLPPGL